MTFYAASKGTVELVRWLPGRTERSSITLQLQKVPLIEERTITALSTQTDEAEANAAKDFVVYMGGSRGVCCAPSIALALAQSGRILSWGRWIGDETYRRSSVRAMDFRCFIGATTTS